MAGMTIGKLAAGAGVGVETVRFYQRRRLAFIRRARQLGFTLGEISDLLGPGDSHGSGAGQRTDDIVRAAETKLAAIGEQIRDGFPHHGGRSRAVSTVKAVTDGTLHLGETVPGIVMEGAAP